MANAGIVFWLLQTILLPLAGFSRSSKSVPVKNKRGRFSGKVMVMVFNCLRYLFPSKSTYPFICVTTISTFSSDWSLIIKFKYTTPKSLTRVSPATKGSASPSPRLGISCKRLQVLEILPKFPLRYQLLRLLFRCCYTFLTENEVF